MVELEVRRAARTADGEEEGSSSEEDIDEFVPPTSQAVKRALNLAIGNPADDDDDDDDDDIGHTPGGFTPPTLSQEHSDDGRFHKIYCMQAIFSSVLNIPFFIFLARQCTEVDSAPNSIHFFIYKYILVFIYYSHVLTYLSSQKVRESCVS